MLNDILYVTMRKIYIQSVYVFKRGLGKLNQAPTVTGRVYLFKLCVYMQILDKKEVDSLLNHVTQTPHLPETKQKQNMRNLTKIIITQHRL